jgi:hypothetical protein
VSADGSHRASDAEREAVADRLRTAAAEGRIEPAELEERLSDVYSARTRSQLESLTRDLPAPVSAPPPPPSPWKSDAVRARLATFITANLVCIAVWAATGANGGFWPKWVVLATGIGLAVSLVYAVLGIEEERHRDRRRRLPR